MAINNLTNIILVLVLNVVFFIAGMCLNSVLILSIWRLSKLRKKVCHFMIMVLSCFNLLLVLVNHPLFASIALL